MKSKNKQKKNSVTIYSYKDGLANHYIHDGGDIYIGIDLALKTTGIALMDYDENLLYCEKIMTSAEGQTEDDRIFYISHRIAEISSMIGVYDAAMEDQHGGLNQKTAMQLSRCRGSAMTSLRHVGASLSYYSASTIKFGLVEGRKVYHPDGRFKNMEVSKEMIADYINQEYPQLVELIGPFNDKDNKDKTSDIYDAISIVKFHIRQRKKQSYEQETEC